MFPYAAVDASAARAQWKLATPALDDLLANWAAEKWAADVGGGDVIREKLGMQGTTSPLYQVKKVFKALRDSDYVEDPVAFVEADEEFMAALFRADSLASSSNNKTGSGKQTPPAVFIEQAKAEVVKNARHREENERPGDVNLGIGPYSSRSRRRRFRDAGRRRPEPCRDRGASKERGSSANDTSAAPVRRVGHLVLGVQHRALVPVRAA